MVKRSRAQVEREGYLEKRVTGETKELLATQEREEWTVNQETPEKMGHRVLQGQKEIRERRASGCSVIRVGLGLQA